MVSDSDEVSAFALGSGGGSGCVLVGGSASCFGSGRMSVGGSGSWFGSGAAKEGLTPDAPGHEPFSR